MKKKFLVLSLILTLLVGVNFVLAQTGVDNPGLENIKRIMEEGAGNSGKIPNGLQEANGIQKKLPCLNPPFSAIPEFILEWGERGTGDGQFAGGPSGIDIDEQDNVYVSDGGRVQKFDSNGNFITSWFGGGEGLAVDSNGNVYVTDGSYGGHKIMKFNSGGNLVATWDEISHGFIGPWDVAVDSNNNLFVADKTRIVKLDSDGNILLEWGSIGAGDYQFREAVGIAVDSQDNVYVVDIDLSRVQVFDNSGIHITTCGSNGDKNSQFRTPIAIHIDSCDYLYIAEYYGNKIKLLMGNGEYISEWGSLYNNSGSEPGEFYAPRDVAIGSDGSIYVVDQGNYRIQKFSL